MDIEGNEDKIAFIAKQVKETVDQTQAGVPFRMGTITCRCGWPRGVMHMFQCLYCREWFCFLCAEKHFGKTVEEYRREQSAKSKRGGLNVTLFKKYE